MTIIALFGPQRSGKSSLAESVENGHLHQWEDFKRARFAGTLYDMAAAFFGGAENVPLDKEQPRDELGGKSLREFLQVLGTEFGRNFLGSEVWVKALLREAERNHADGFGTIVDDLRFQNEFDALREAGAFIVRIERRGTGPQGDHASEIDWQNFEPHATLKNDLGLEQWQDVGREILLEEAEKFFQS